MRTSVRWAWWVGYWTLISAALLPLTVLRFGLTSIVLPLWAYGLGAGFAALVTLFFLRRRFLQRGRGWKTWLRDWLLVGTVSALAAVAGGVTIFVLDLTLSFSQGGEGSQLSLPIAILLTAGSAVVIWLIAAAASSLVAVAEGLLAAVVAIPVVWLVWLLERRRGINKEP